MSFTVGNFSDPYLSYLHIYWYLSSIFSWNSLLAIFSSRSERFASILVFGQYLQTSFTVSYFDELYSSYLYLPPIFLF